MTGEVGTVYLLCFSGPLHHAKHYCGWCRGDDPARRIQEHLRGHGSPLVKAALDAGLEVKLVRTWRGTRDFEREIKNGKNTSRLCPDCAPGYNERARERMRRYRSRSR